MNHLYLFLRRVLIVFLVSTLTFVSTFTGEAIADEGDFPVKIDININGVPQLDFNVGVPDIADQSKLERQMYTVTESGTNSSGTSLIDSCSIYPGDISVAGTGFMQPDFKNPPFAYTNDTDEQDRQGVTLDAVQDKFYLDVDRNDKTGYEYDGYLYKTIFYNQKPENDGNKPQTIVRNEDQSAQIEVAEYNPTNPPENMVGTYTPPTIVTSPGKFKGDTPPDLPSLAQLNSFDLTLENDLPVRVQLAGKLPPTKENLENQSQYTNLHYHGFNVSPLLSSDDVLVDVPSNVTPLTGFTPTSTDSILPGGYYPTDTPDDPQYGGPISEYKMTVKMPYVHQSGLFWYHSHAHSMSQQQVRGGLSGGIIIKGMDDYYNFLNQNEGLQVQSGNLILESEPEQFSVNQKVMMFKDFNDVLAGGQQKCFTLNGQVNPKITIKPGEVQLWRIANSGSDEYMNIALEQGTKTWVNDHYEIQGTTFAEPNGEANFIILARDGDVVEEPFQTDSVLLPPATRVELLVVGGKAKTTEKTDGKTEYYLVSDLTTELTAADQNWVNAPKSQILATVEVEEGVANKVCYKKGQDDSSLQLASVECSGDDSLYSYLKTLPNYQDKILPPSKDIMADTLEDCRDKYDHYAYKIRLGKKIVYGSLTPYDGNPGASGKRCITQPTERESDTPMYTDPRTKKRYFYFSADNGKFFLKGFEEEKSNPVNKGEIKELFDGTRIDKVSRTGDLEEWHLVNADSRPHVFHIHQLDFVVTKVTVSQDLRAEPFDKKYNNYKVKECQSQDIILPNGDKGYECKLNSQGYRDVINLPKNSVTTVRIPFVNPFITGTFVYHCHLLGHEDRGMMNNIQVVNPDGFEISGVAPTAAPIEGDGEE